MKSTVDIIRQIKDGTLHEGTSVDKDIPFDLFCIDNMKGSSLLKIKQKE